MKVSSDDEILLSGHGVLHDILSITQAVMKVRPQKSKSQDEECYVLVDKDIIFLNEKKRCENFVEIKGKTLFVRGFKVLNTRVKYRAMTVLDSVSIYQALSYITRPNRPLVNCPLDTKIEGVVIGFHTVSEAIAQVEGGNKSFLVLCNITSFVHRGNWKSDLIFENVGIGEKVRLKVSLKSTKKHEYLKASAVYQKSTTPKDAISIAPVVSVEDGCILHQESFFNSPLIQDDFVTINDESLIKITERGIIFRKKSKRLFGKPHGSEMSASEMKSLTDNTMYVHCFTGIGVLVRVVSASEAILIVQVKNITVAVVVCMNDIYVHKNRCKTFDQIRKKYLFVNCIKTKYEFVDDPSTEKDALSIPFRAISAHLPGSKLPGMQERFNMANPLINKLEERKVYHGRVTAFSTFSCAIVEIIENNTSHLITLRKRSLVTNEKKSSVLAGCLKIGEKLDLTIAIHKGKNGVICYRAVKAVLEGSDFPEESSCSVVQVSDGGRVRRVSLASDCSLSSGFSKNDHLAKLEMVPKKKRRRKRAQKRDSGTTMPSSIDTVSQVQETPHLSDVPHLLTDIIRELQSEFFSKMYFLELNEVVGIVSSFKSRSEGILVIDGLNHIKVQFSIKNVVWWNEFEEREARLLPLQNLFPLDSFLMVCALPTPGENIFTATKVWKPA